MWESRSDFQAWVLFQASSAGPSDGSAHLVAVAGHSFLVSTAQAIRASLFASATMATF